MKKAIALATCAFIAQVTFALTETVDGIKWTYHLKNGDAILGDYEVVARYSGQIGTNYYHAINQDTDGAIKIPDVLDGHKVVEVGSFAFNNCSSMTEVSFGEGITNIAASAFANCSSLTNVCFNEGLQSIQTNAFYKCSGLKTVSFPESLVFLDWSAFDTIQFPSGTAAYYSTPTHMGCGLQVVFFKGDCPETKGQLNGLYWKDEYNGDYYSIIVLTVAGKNGWGEPGTTWAHDGELMHGTARVYQMRGQNIASKRQIVDPGDVITLACTNTITYVPRTSGEHKTLKPTKIYYTIDGSEPTTNSLLYAEGIPIEHATTIKASIVGKSITFLDATISKADPSDLRRTIYPEWYMSFSPWCFYGGPFINYGVSYYYYRCYCDLRYNVSETCSYAFGQTLVPEISTSQQLFNWSGNVVTLSCETEGAEIRYTLDGREPTEESELYTGPFTIDDTTTIRAKAFKTDWFNSETATATFTREWYTVKPPVIEPSDAEFANSSQEVSISCATEGATIWYTVDGREPEIGSGFVYDAPFTIYRSCTVKAVAVKDDWLRSAVTEKSFVRAESLSEAANMYGYTMETDETNPWFVVCDVSKDGMSSVCSGAIGNNGSAYIQSSVKKSGMVSFWWRAQCEEPDEEDGEDGYYDYGVFLVDDMVVARIAGNDTGWRRVEYQISTGGKHVLRWEYRKDGATTYAPDCIWLDCVQWLPVGGPDYTTTTPTPVPHSWLNFYGLGVEMDYETTAISSRGRTVGRGSSWCVWQDYVAGTDPTREDDIFTATIEFDETGKPVIDWLPKLEAEEAERRTYTTYGKVSLDDKDWTPIPEGEEGNYNFFKVNVELR